MPSEAESLEAERLRAERLRSLALQRQAQLRLEQHSRAGQPSTIGATGISSQVHTQVDIPDDPSTDLTRTVQLKAGDKIPSGTVFLNPDFSTLPKFIIDKQGKKRLTKRVVPRLRAGDTTPVPLNPTLVTPRGKRMALQTGAATLAELAIPVPGTGILSRGLRFLRPVAGEGAGSLASEGFDPSGSPVGRAIQEMGVGLLGEGFAGLGLRGVRKIFGESAFIRPGVKEAQELLKKEGGSLTAAQATRGILPDALENISEASFLAGSLVPRQKIKAGSIVTRNANEFVDALKSTASQEEIGALLQDSIIDGAAAFTTTGGALYGKIDNLNSVGVDITGLQEAALESYIKSRQGLKSSPIEDMAADIIDRPNIVSWEEASALRSDLIAFDPVLTDVVKGKAKGKAKLLSGELDNIMAATARNLDPEAEIAWREANKFWSEGKVLYNSSFIKSLVKRDPETVFETIIKQKRPGTIRKIRNIVNNAEDWRAIQGQFLDNWLTKSAGKEVGELSGDKLGNYLAQFGDATLKEIFPGGSTVQNLETFARTAQLAQLKPEAGHFRLAVQFGQAGVILSFLTRRGTNVADVITLGLGPAALAKIYTSPLGFKLLVTGFKAPPGSQQAFKAAARFMTFAKENQILELSNKFYSDAVDELEDLLKFNQAKGAENVQQPQPVLAPQRAPQDAPGGSF